MLNSVADILQNVAGGVTGQASRELQRLMHQMSDSHDGISYNYSPGPKRVWYILGFKFASAAAFAMYQYVFMDLLKIQFGFESTSWADWMLHASTVAFSTIFAWNVETMVPLFVVLCLFIALMLVGLLLTLLAYLVSSSTFLFLGALCAFAGSVAIHPWMTVFAADQLPKVKSAQRSALFLYAFSSMYLGIALADASTPWLLARLGHFLVLLAVFVLLAVATVLFFKGNANSVKIASAKTSSISDFMKCWVACRFDLSNLAASEKLDLPRDDGFGDWTCWVDRCHATVPANVRKTVKLLTALAPYTFALGAFHAVFGSLELNASLHGASTVGSLSLEVPCLGPKQLEIVKALYAVAVVPLLDAAILPVLWSAPDLTAKPTPLRRVAVGMLTGAAACLITVVIQLMMYVTVPSPLICIVQILRTAVVVLAEVLVGGGCIEFAYASGLSQSANARISASWFVYAFIAGGENLSGPLLACLSIFLPVPVIYIMCAAVAAACGIFYIPRAWQLGGKQDTDATAQTSTSRYILPGSQPDDEHTPASVVEAQPTLRSRKKPTEPSSK